MKNTNDDDSNQPDIFFDVRPKINKVAASVDVLLTLFVVVLGPLGVLEAHKFAAGLLPEGNAFALLHDWFIGARLLALDVAIFAFLYLAIASIYDRHF